MRRVFIPQNLQSLPAQLPIGEISTVSGHSMGTTWSVRYVNLAFKQHSEDEVSVLIERELDLVVAQMSTWQVDSNLSRFNRAEASTWHAIPRPFFDVLDCALKLAAETDGAFDPTIGPIVNLWGFGPEGVNISPPGAEAIKAKHAECGWQKLVLDDEGMRVMQPGGVYVDFSGIAKGYSVDRIAQALDAAGIQQFLVEVGGELYGAGIKPDGLPWWVALETPPDSTSIIASVVAMHGVAIATSGNYRRYFEHLDRRYAHTIDPRTGYPVDLATNALVSVTVLHAKCMLADALATAFTVMGTEAALAYAEHNNIAVLLIEQTSDGFEEHVSSQWMAMLQ
ncbi:MAG: FAD:protein FMN transferase [Methylophilus sp.]|nr:FAD:protein FMN transferase [Methylophilus sp.]